MKRNATCTPMTRRMRDIDVRRAMLAKVHRDHANEADTLIIEELGVEHGEHRVDLAVINGLIHAYEFKSQSDRLSRLPSQSLAYSRTFDRVTLVVDRSHLEEALTIIPNWWGVETATMDSDEKVSIHVVREGEMNPSADILSMAHFLWRDEAVEILEVMGVEKRALRQSRALLYKLLVETVEPIELTQMIRRRLVQRQNWRGHVSPS